MARRSSFTLTLGLLRTVMSIVLKEQNHASVQTFVKDFDAVEVLEMKTSTGSGFNSLEPGFVAKGYAYVYDKTTGLVGRTPHSNFKTSAIKFLQLSKSANTNTGFSSGDYGYFLDGRAMTVERFSLTSFTKGSPSELDLEKGLGLNHDDKVWKNGWRLSFASGDWGYVVPDAENPPSKARMVIRFKLSDFSTVEKLQIEDSSLGGFYHGFEAGGYGYVLPVHHSKSKLIRFLLSDFKSVEVMDLSAKDSDLKGFCGGFASGGYAYALPTQRPSKVARFRLSDFSANKVEVLDLSAINKSLNGFNSGFVSGDYGYVVSFYDYVGKRYNGQVARFKLSDFSTVEVLNVEAKSSPALKGFVTSFTGGGYAYLVPRMVSRLGRFKIAPEPTPAPTLATTTTTTKTTTSTASGNSGTSGASGVAVEAKGDPHLQNIHGQRFDLRQPGKHALLHIPKGAVASNAVLLHVAAEAQQMGARCADMYFQDLNVTGVWAEAEQAGGFRFRADEAGCEGQSRRLSLGKVDLKISHGCTTQGVHYINFNVKHLGHIGMVVGGLLGEDDHTVAETASKECRRRLSLWSKQREALDPIAVASLA